MSSNANPKATSAERRAADRRTPRRNPALLGWTLSAALLLGGGVLAPVSAGAAGIDQSVLAAVMQDSPDKIAALARRHADLNSPNDQGNPPLHIALREESWRAARALIEAPGIDLDRANGNGETPLMLAALKGQRELVELLIAKGANVNREGWTPLHYAASNGQPGQLDIVRLLLEHYAFINAQSPNNTTPLMMAAGYGSPAVVKLLIDEGAFLDVKNQQGMTARDFALRAENGEAMNLLTQAAQAAFTGGKW